MVARGGHATRIVRLRGGISTFAVIGRVCLLAAVGATRLAATRADPRHVAAVLADHFPALAARLACFLRIELVGIAATVGRSPALARDFALSLGIHRGESARLTAFTRLFA